MRHSSPLVLGLTALILLVATPAAFAQQSVQSLIQRYYSQQRQEQEQLQQAMQKRNEAQIKQYQDAMKKRQEAYAKQMEEFRKAGVTPQQFLQMQREAILAQVPKSRHGALKRRWIREDRIRERALAIDRRNGRTPNTDADAGLDLGGGFGDLGDDDDKPEAEEKTESTEKKPEATEKPESTEEKPETVE